MIRQYFRKYFEKLKVIAGKILHTNDSPVKIALGFTLGVFIGVFPTFFIGGILAVGLCALFKLNYTAALLGMAVTANPVVSPLVWIVSAKIGGLIFSENIDSVIDMFKSGTLFKSAGRAVFIYFAGNLVVSIIVSVIAFFSAKTIFERHSRKMGKR